MKNGRLSLFVSIFFECCQCTNKFSPFWVYSQWNKPNLVCRHIIIFFVGYCYPICTQNYYI